MSRKLIHVNQHVIRKNKKEGTNDPVLTCKTKEGNIYGSEVVIYGQDGLPAAKVVYSPEKPLSCGARVWIETIGKIDVESFGSIRPIE